MGKARSATRCAALHRHRGYTCTGIITLRSPTGQLDVRDVRSGEQRQLTTSITTAQSLVQGRFTFDAQTISWGNQVLAAAVPCDLLMVDELGPIEFVRGQGWMTAFDVLAHRDYAVALVVIRAELLARAQEKLPFGTKAVVDVTQENRDSLGASLVERIGQRIDAHRG
ncbi:MAG: hypothetical protein MUQ10_05850 [Anaerolineae bacterium]|nr:hypothetical protein [Anaerolineae bacterium]